MGVFTRLAAGELAEIAAAFDLGAVRRSAAMSAGTINSNFDVETERGRWFVRLNEGKAEVDVAWEARLVEALAAAGVVTPPPLRATDGRPYAQVFCADPGARKWVSVFAWRAGRHLAASEVTPALAGALGAALAQLHLAGEQLPTSWRRGSIYDHDHLVARYGHFSSSMDPALRRAVDILGEELAEASAAAAIRRRASSGIIHGDLFRDNVLWEGDRITAILDFEQASGGSFAYDLAVCINDWCFALAGSIERLEDESPDRPAPGSSYGGRRFAPPAVRMDVVAALLEGYGRVRPLTAADRAALPIEVRAAATRFTITRITDVYLARVDNPDKDFRAFLARVEAWRGPALGQLSSLL